MTATREVEVPPSDGVPEPARSVWRGLLISAGLGSAVAFAGTAAVLGDLEAGAYAAAFGVGLGLLRWRTGRAGVIVLGLLSLNVLGWMALGALSNLRGAAGTVAVAIPSLLTALSVVAVIAAAADLARRLRPGGSRAAAGAVAAVAAVGFVALTAAGGLSAAGADSAAGTGQDAALTVVSDNVRFDPERLGASAGEVTIRLSNRDLFWHTLTIDELDVDVPVAVNATGAVTFDAPAGTYEYYCRVPGHEARMRGSLVVGE